MSCRAAAAVVALCLSLGAGDGHAAASRGRRAVVQTLSLDAACGAVYDDNVLQYSDSLLHAFTAGTRRDLFDLYSTDDVTFLPSVALTWTRARRSGVGSALRVAASGRYHAHDTQANDTAWSARWRQTLAPGRRVAVGYYWLPGYYLRQLRDEDAVPAYHRLSRYRRAAFDLGIATAELHERVARGLAVDGEFRSEHRAYVPAFRERTSTLRAGTLTLLASGLPARGSAEFAAGYAWSHARATDGDDTLNTVPDDVDVGYRGPLGHLALRADVAHAGDWRLGADARLEVENRRFTSTRAGDLYHAGRRDAGLAEEVGLRLDPPGAWGVRVSYRHERNIARLGSAAPASADSGDYRQQQVGITVSYAADLWGGVRAHRTAEGGR